MSLVQRAPNVADRRPEGLRPTGKPSPAPPGDRPCSGAGPARPLRKEDLRTNQPPLASRTLVGGAGAPDARQLRAILITVSIALMAVIASASGLNVAQTHLAVEFGASQNTVLWIINVYTLVLAALLLPLGAVGDRLGRKPMLITGLVVFGAAGVVAGLAPSAAVMIGARAAAGVGAAMIMPITLAVITSTFP
ncbi:hypothetical protein SUDANB151_00087 [Streptomyces sp. enrichment culture]